MKRKILFVLWAMLCSPVFAAEAPSPVESEVTVSATRRLAEMRKEIALAEDRFLAKYNELNQVREYAITCTLEATTGSRFNRRVCRPAYVGNTTATEAKGWFFGYGTPAAQLVMASKRDDFRKNMIDLATKSPQLRQLAEEHQNLLDRYNQLLRVTLGAAPGK